VDVVATAEHAEYLEFGTSKMAARPFMRPAAMAMRGKIIKELVNAVERGLNVGRGT
jgi:HK97 gp10 family phage protein